MKLIDADALRKDVLDLPNCYNGYSDTYDKSLIIGLIDEQIAVDAVPVVRCKDCEYHTAYDECNWDIGQNNYPYTDEDDFCSHGERKKR